MIIDDDTLTAGKMRDGLSPVVTFSLKIIRNKTWCWRLVAEFAVVDYMGVSGKPIVVQKS